MRAPLRTSIPQTCNSLGNLLEFFLLPNQCWSHPGQLSNYRCQGWGTGCYPFWTGYGDVLVFDSMVMEVVAEVEAAVVDDEAAAAEGTWVTTSLN